MIFAPPSTAPAATPEDVLDTFADYLVAAGRTPGVAAQYAGHVQRIMRAGGDAPALSHSALERGRIYLQDLALSTQGIALTAWRAFRTYGKIRKIAIPSLELPYVVTPLPDEALLAVFYLGRIHKTITRAVVSRLTWAPFDIALSSPLPRVVTVQTGFGTNDIRGNWGAPKRLQISLGGQERYFTALRTWACPLDGDSPLVPANPGNAIPMPAKALIPLYEAAKDAWRAAQDRSWRILQTPAATSAALSATPPLATVPADVLTPEQAAARDFLRHTPASGPIHIDPLDPERIAKLEASFGRPLTENERAIFG